jgi:hypothetical protein
MMLAVRREYDIGRWVLLSADNAGVEARERPQGSAKSPALLDGSVISLIYHNQSGNAMQEAQMSGGSRKVVRGGGRGGVYAEGCFKPAILLSLGWMGRRGRARTWGQCMWSTDRPWRSGQHVLSRKAHRSTLTTICILAQSDPPSSTGDPTRRRVLGMAGFAPFLKVKENLHHCLD